MKVAIDDSLKGPIASALTAVLIDACEFGEVSDVESADVVIGRNARDMLRYLSNGKRAIQLLVEQDRDIPGTGMTTNPNFKDRFVILGVIDGIPSMIETMARFREELASTTE